MGPVPVKYVLSIRVIFQVTRCCREQAISVVDSQVVRFPARIGYNASSAFERRQELMLQNRGIFRNQCVSNGLLLFRLKNGGLLPDHRTIYYRQPLD